MLWMIFDQRQLQFQNNQKMGNSTNQIGKQLKFIQAIDDKHFGQIDIYKSEDGHYIMKIKRNFIVDDRRHVQFKKVLQWINNQKSNLIAPIISINSTIQNNICIKYQLVEILTEYYNYTLRNLIIHKKQLDQAQLWFILQTLLHLTTILRKNRLGINLDLQNVFITLNGTLCVYMHHLISFQESIQCNQYGMAQLIAFILMQLTIGQSISFQNHQLSGKQILVYVSKMCNKYKILGKIIKQLLNRQKSQEDVLGQIKCLLQSNRIKKASQIKLNKFKYAIPQPNQLKETPRLSTQQKNPLELKIVQFKPQKKSMDTIKKSRNITIPSIQNSIIPKEHTHVVNPYIDEIRNKLKQKMGKEMNTKILIDIEEKKRQNELKKQRFQMRKQQLINALQKQNKENISFTSHSKDIKEQKPNKLRKQTQTNCQPKKKMIN